MTFKEQYQLKYRFLRASRSRVDREVFDRLTWQVLVGVTNRRAEGAARRVMALRQLLEEIAEAGEYNNCAAVLVANGQNGAGDWDSLAASSYLKNSYVTSVPVSSEWLRKRCLRISEDLARKLHPNLFIMLDKE